MDGVWPRGRVGSFSSEEENLWMHTPTPSSVSAGEEDSPIPFNFDVEVVDFHNTPSIPKELTNREVALLSVGITCITILVCAYLNYLFNPNSRFYSGLNFD